MLGFGLMNRDAAEAARRGPVRRADRRLLEAARAGDRHALDQLVGRIAPTVFRFSRAFCRDRSDAEDVLQETLAAMVRELRGFRGESALSTWAFVVARNSCARMRRRRRREHEAIETMAHRPDAAAPVAEPDREFDRNALGRALDLAVRELPRAWREAILLRDVEGLSAAEAASALGIGERALKSRLHRARAALRAALRDGVTGAARGREPRPPGCPDLPVVFGRYLEGELGARACAELEGHIAGCARCGPECDELLASLARCRRARTAKPPLRVRRAVRAALRAALESTTRPGASGPRPAGSRAGA